MADGESPPAPEGTRNVAFRAGDKAGLGTAGATLLQTQQKVLAEDHRRLQRQPRYQEPVAWDPDHRRLEALSADLRRLFSSAESAE